MAASRRGMGFRGRRGVLDCGGSIEGKQLVEGLSVRDGRVLDEVIGYPVFDSILLVEWLLSLGLGI